jgi:hypothetical protein
MNLGWCASGGLVTIRTSCACTQIANDTFIQPCLIRILVAALEPKKSMQTPNSDRYDCDKTKAQLSSQRIDPLLTV